VTPADQHKEAVVMERVFGPNGGIGELVLRLGLGITFFAHGREKIKNPAGFAGFLRQIHVPAPLLNAWMVALLETLGAVLLIVGIATRLIALGLAIDMLVALLTLRIGKAPFTSGGQGAGWDFEFILLIAALALVFTGAGRLGIDPYIGWPR
jgi:putative oxidoreductase